MGEINSSKASDLSAPHLLTEAHSLDDFDCGRQALNNWLKRFALQNQRANAARTFAVCEKNHVVGYYSLAVGSINHEIAAPRIKKGLARHPIPVMILARLAVDSRYQGRKIGSGLLKDAIYRTLQAADYAGIRAILVHAKDDSARSFYDYFDFESSPLDPFKLMLLIKDARKIVESFK